MRPCTETTEQMPEGSTFRITFLIHRTTILLGTHHIIDTDSSQQRHRNDQTDLQIHGGT